MNGTECKPKGPFIWRSFSVVVGLLKLAGAFPLKLWQVPDGPADCQIA